MKKIYLLLTALIIGSTISANAAWTFYHNGDGDNNNWKSVAMTEISTNVYQLTINLPGNYYGGQNFNFNDGSSGWGNNSASINLADGKSTSFTCYINQNCWIAGSGTYTFTLNTSTKSLTVLKGTPAPSLNSPVISIVGHNNPAINGVARGAKYFTVKIDHASTNPGTKIYYTIDYSTGTASASSATVSTSSTPYTGEFQIPARCVIKAIDTKDGASSAVASQGHTQSVTFAWETPDAQDRLKKFRVKVLSEEGKGYNAKLTLVLEDHDNAADYGGKNDTPYSWAKYEDFDAYEEFKNTHSFSYDIDDATDHAPTPNTDKNGFLDLESNDTDTHYARNFTPAYYRAYVQSDVAPSSVGSNRVRPYAENDSDSSWETNPNPAAGNIDPYANARIAYTLPVAYDDTPTGVEDVIADGAISSDDANAPVVYYNLQGVRVENPSNGIFIRVQGKKTEKIMLH